MTNLFSSCRKTNLNNNHILNLMSSITLSKKIVGYKKNKYYLRDVFILVQG